MIEHCAQIVGLSQGHCCKTIKIIELSFQELLDDILEKKVDSEIRGQVIRNQTQKQSFNFFFENK